MFPYSLLVLLLCLCKSFQRTLSLFAPKLVSQKRMQRYHFYPYTPNIPMRNVMYLTFVCIFARTQGASVGYTPYYIKYKGRLCVRTILSRILRTRCEDSFQFCPSTKSMPFPAYIVFVFTFYLSFCHLLHLYDWYSTHYGWQIPILSVTHLSPATTALLHPPSYSIN